MPGSIEFRYGFDVPDERAPGDLGLDIVRQIVVPGHARLLILGIQPDGLAERLNVCRNDGRHHRDTALLPGDVLILVNGRSELIAMETVLATARTLCLRVLRAF